MFNITFSCKTDPTVRDHPSPANAHRMSYESFSFVGVDSSITYLQCDVLICDNNAPDQRCKNRECLEENVRRRRNKRSYDNHQSLSRSADAFNIHSGPVMVTNQRTHHVRVQRSIDSPPVHKPSQKILYHERPGEFF